MNSRIDPITANTRSVHFDAELWIMNVFGDVKSQIESKRKVYVPAYVLLEWRKHRRDLDSCPHWSHMIGRHQGGDLPKAHDNLVRAIDELVERLTAIHHEDIEFIQPTKYEVKNILRLGRELSSCRESLIKY